MPWQESSTVSQRHEFVRLAQAEGANMRALSRAFHISPTTAYRWRARAAAGDTTLADRSHRPQAMPRHTSPEVEAQVLALRAEHPAWGGRKLRARLLALGVASVPAASTITDILHRAAAVPPRTAGPTTGRSWQRFEHPYPNALWQMDFKGHVPLAAGTARCHPLTVLDDHSRFNLVLAACADEQAATVQTHLTACFRRYGLPDGVLCDNGQPWGDGGTRAYTALGAWLLRLGIAVHHGRPYHPQTQGKDERFHHTLVVEVLTGPPDPTLERAQQRFDRWRDCYNLERPHEALDNATPVTRYTPSERLFPEVLPPIVYAPGDQVRKVQRTGVIDFRGRPWYVGKAFRGQPVGLRPTATDGQLAVYFCHQPITTLDLHSPRA